MDLKKFLRAPWGRLMDIPEEVPRPKRYSIIRRDISILMLVITVVPLVLMALINYHQYQSALKDEIVAPLRLLVNKAKHSFELFLTNRLATVRFIASAYSYDELANEKNLNRVFRELKREFEGFVDLGLIDSKGIQVSYVGPYDLKGKDYSSQEWFEQVKVNGMYISDVFMGYRKFPHVVIAVQHTSESGNSWVVRATIDTRRFDEIIAAMGLDPQSDAFLINRDGILQTVSKFYGNVLSECRDCVQPLSYEPTVVQKADSRGREVLMAYAYFSRPDFILMVVKPQGEVLKAWYTLKSELLLVFVASLIIIVVVVLRLARLLVDRMQMSDERRELAFRELQHSHKLSSIGRLAAGVAHEINNPMAIINEKAGLMKDLIEFDPQFPNRGKFLGLVAAIAQSVDRCRTITHRLLGFARRMEVEIEVLNVNDVVTETAGFLEKEALHRNIRLRLHLDEKLPRIASDRGQLQQVFLNMFNNAFEAVQDGGLVSVATWDRNPDTVGVTIQDDGVGMSEDTLKHIFEPFFTTKKGTGTGLGLSITYGIIRRLGGDIEVQSKVGQGTRFTVFLPKKPGEGSGV
ncbi:MAG: two-component sensor histidine kinase [Desulfomonile tiedjei]|nr:two-component sensor histidine kinase [Desulfomonile tiedjei]